VIGAGKTVGLDYDVVYQLFVKHGDKIMPVRPTVDNASDCRTIGLVLGVRYIGCPIAR